jgi:hypothetical protein
MMNRWILVCSVILMVVYFTAGCASNGSIPSCPGITGNQTISAATENASQTQLWGLYDVYIDIPTKTVTATVNRQAMFTANVVQFVNGKPPKLAFHINDTPVGADYVDVDIDVSITHPFPGLTQYNGYDVRGVFMGNGSTQLQYTSLIYASLGTDQFMLPDPDDQQGGPDGYTRWFNKTEFSTGGMPLLSYTKGSVASPNFDGTATLNPYKYFADGLTKDDDLWTWLGNNASAHSVFSAGQTNTRNYYLRFPNATGVKYGYAILANWKGTDPTDHPANAPEAVGCKVTDNSNLWFIDNSQKGGGLNFDISIWDWDATLSAGLMEDYKLFIDSTVLSATHQFTPSEMIPTGGDANFSTYHVEIAPDQFIGATGNEFWVIVESPNQNYKNDLGTTNLAGDAPLAAFFRFNLNVSSSPLNADPVCNLVIDPTTPNPAEDFAPVGMKFDASGSTDPDGDTLSFAWDFDGDGDYGEATDDAFTGTPDKPSHGFSANYTGKVYVKVTDGKGGEAICSVDVQVTAHPSKNIPLRSGTEAVDLGIDPSNGDLWIVSSDLQNWKYTLTGWYANGAYQYTVPEPGGTLQWMDVAKGGYAHLMELHPVYSPTEWLLNNTGGIVVGMGWGGADNHFRDTTNYPSTGTFADSLMMYMGYYHTYYSTNITMIRGYMPPSYGLSSMYYTETWVYPPLTGIDKIYQDYLVAIDSDVSGNSFWALEHTDFYCGRFKANGPAGWVGQSFDNAYFGTGTEQTGDTCWTMDVVDMSRDKNGKFHVLDLVDGHAIVKEFTGSASGGSSLGHYGNTDETIKGLPIAIDGDDFGGRMFVIHGSASTGYFLSIFMPSEYPG